MSHLLTMQRGTLGYPYVSTLSVTTIHSDKAQPSPRLQVKQAYAGNLYNTANTGILGLIQVNTLLNVKFKQFVISCWKHVRFNSTKFIIKRVVQFFAANFTLKTILLPNIKYRSKAVSVRFWEFKENQPSELCLESFKSFKVFLFDLSHY